MKLAPAILAVMLLVLAGATQAATWCVDPAGNDANAGTAESPWKTLKKAVAVAGPGDTVEVRAGVYSERLLFSRSGTREAPIVFRAAAGAKPVIDGTNLPVVSGWSPLVQLAHVNHITFQGFELRNYRTSQRYYVPMGILVNGEGEGIRILDNHIHHIETNVTRRTGGDAHGIAVYGQTTTGIKDLIIKGNLLHDLKLGSSEAMVVNGNVENFLVEDNTVHNSNNIGIDVIGHEGICSDPDRDIARRGTVRHNTVYAITSILNPAYGGYRAAGGIYVDGGADLLIEQNSVTECDIGIELASEHPGQGTVRVHVRNNLVRRSHIGGIFVGGYDTARGYTDACVLENNTLVENDTVNDWNGEICLQNDVRNTVFRNNVIMTNSQGLVVSNQFLAKSGVVFDHNVYWAPQGTGLFWQWSSNYYHSFDAWKSASGQDSNSRVADPLFENFAAGNFSLTPRSPAIDVGDPSSPGLPTELDLAGNTRLIGPARDAGAYEFALSEFSTQGTGDTQILSFENGKAALTVHRRSDWQQHGLSYKLEVNRGSLDPTRWEDFSHNATQHTVATNPDEGTEQVKFLFSPPAAAIWFARVIVTVLP